MTQCRAGAEITVISVTVKEIGVYCLATSFTTAFSDFNCSNVEGGPDLFREREIEKDRLDSISRILSGDRVYWQGHRNFMRNT